MLGSGNLGLIYLMEEPRRLTLEEIDERHPKLIAALREHPHVGWLLVRSSEHGPVVLGPRGEHYLADGRVVGDDPLAPFSKNAAYHLRRTDGFEDVADIMVNSFYDPQLDEGCAFEELISFHGGMGGWQTQAFILHPVALPLPDGEIVGAAAVHGVLLGWRESLQGPLPAPGSARPGRRRGGLAQAVCRGARRWYAMSMGTTKSMSYTIKNLGEVEDMAPKFGFWARSTRPASPAAIWAPRRRASRTTSSSPAASSPSDTATRCRGDLRRRRGSGRVKLDDEVREIERLDAIRVAPSVGALVRGGPRRPRPCSPSARTTRTTVASW